MRLQSLHKLDYLDTVVLLEGVCGEVGQLRLPLQGLFLVLCHQG